MQTVEFTRKQFENLAPLELASDISHAECDLFLIPVKSRWHTHIDVLKSFYIQNTKSFGNKLYVINTLIDEKEKLNIPELITPDHLAIVNHNVVGYSMPYIDNINLAHALKDYNIPITKKIEYLRSIGQILNKMKKLRDKHIEDNFYLADIHENQFIINKETDEINVVDLDSCVIGTSQPSPSKYLETNPNISQLRNKYPCNVFINIPNENSDLLCYNMMILNFIANSNINMLPIEEYYDYLNYLSDMKFNKGLLDSFGTIYTNANNINPEPYLDTLSSYTPESSYPVYTYKKNKKRI